MTTLTDFVGLLTISQALPNAIVFVQVRWQYLL